MQNIKTHKANRLGIASNVSDCNYKDSFITNTPIKIKDLTNHLSSSYFENHPFNAKKYIDHTAILENKEAAKEKQLKNILKRSIKAQETKIDNLKVVQQKIYLKKAVQPSEPIEKEDIDQIMYSILSDSLTLNTTICSINNKPHKNGFNVIIDSDSDAIEYTYTIYFDASSQKIKRLGGSIKAAKRYKAIIITTTDVETLFFFVEKAYNLTEADELRKAVYDEFYTQVLNTTNTKDLIFLLDYLPYYIKYGYALHEDVDSKPHKLTDKLLWEIFLRFIKSDRVLRDASYYVLKVMTLMSPKFCMQKFLEDQSLVIKIYSGLDDQSSFEDFLGLYPHSKTLNIGKVAFEATNKDAFITLLNLYIQIYESDSSVAVFESNDADFHQGVHNVEPTANEGYRHNVKYTLDSNIMFSNTGEHNGKVYIHNKWTSKKELGQNFTQNGITFPKELSYGYNQIGAYYNPLDVVKFTQHDGNGGAITLNVPAIYVKYASDLKEWEKVYENLQFGGNLLAIVAGLGIITASVGSLMLCATIAEMGFSYADILIQSEKDHPYFKKGPGKEFLETWNKIYSISSLALGAPVFIKAVALYSGKLITSGADLLQVAKTTITNPEVYKRVKGITAKAIRSLEIPNFNKTGLEILKTGFKSIPELRNADKLQKLGVIFVKGGQDTMAAIYKGVVIAYGKAEIVALQLRRAIQKLRGKQLEEYLEKLRYLGGTAENIKIIENVDLFLASAKRLADLKITSKNALQYLDEALPHFNHKIVESVVDGVLEKAVMKIGSENCASVAKVVDEYLKTGKITKAEPIGLSGFEFFGKGVGDFPQLSLISMQKVMKEGERGIIYGVLGSRPGIRNGEAVLEVVGHYFNVIKKDGILLYKDGQIGRDAILGFRKYEKYRYLKTN